MHYNIYFLVSFFLFSLGLFLTITSQNLIRVLIGIELILNATNVNLVAFDLFNNRMDGQMFALFVMLIAVCETAVALAIIYKVYQYFKTIRPSSIDMFKN